MTTAIQELKDLQRTFAGNLDLVGENVLDGEKISEIEKALFHTLASS